MNDVSVAKNKNAQAALVNKFIQLKAHKTSTSTRQVSTSIKNPFFYLEHQHDTLLKRFLQIQFFQIKKVLYQLIWFCFGFGDFALILDSKITKTKAIGFVLQNHTQHELLEREKTELDKKLFFSYNLGKKKNNSQQSIMKAIVKTNWFFCKIQIGVM